MKHTLLCETKISLLSAALKRLTEVFLKNENVAIINIVDLTFLQRLESNFFFTDGMFSL
jgi:hypothetical protein